MDCLLETGHRLPHVAMGEALQTEPTERLVKSSQSFVSIPQICAKKLIPIQSLLKSPSTAFNRNNHSQSHCGYTAQHQTMQL